MKRVKKIYKYVQVRAERCYACNSGWIYGRICSSCNGKGYHYKTVRRLVGEEVIE